MLLSVGVYSVISYTVTHRRQEIGIPIALGASERDVRSLVLGSVCGTFWLALESAYFSRSLWDAYSPVRSGASRGTTCILFVA